MKLTSYMVSALVTGFLFIGCKDAASKPAEASKQTTRKEIAAATNPETAVFKIDGMTCSMGCAKTIEEKLAEMEGVQKAKVDFETKTATVNFDLDKIQSDDLTKAVEGCADGKTYKVSEVKIGKS